MVALLLIAILLVLIYAFVPGLLTLALFIAGALLALAVLWWLMVAVVALFAWAFGKHSAP